MRGGADESLEMSDPDAQTDEVAPPPQPPRKPTVPTSTEQSQLAADEQYARQLAEHYNTSATYGAPRSGSRGGSNPPVSGPERVNSRQYLKSEDERERSFIDGQYFRMVQSTHEIYLTHKQTTCPSFATTSRRAFWTHKPRSTAG